MRRAARAAPPARALPDRSPHHRPPPPRRCWDLETNKVIRAYDAHLSGVYSLALHPTLGAFPGARARVHARSSLRTLPHSHPLPPARAFPPADILFSGGRDSAVRVWDVRTRTQIHVLSGHESTVSALLANETDPQVLSGSMDNTIKLWDLAAGKVRTTLTHHKKSVRALVGHPRDFAFLSGAADNIKKWALPEGTLVANLGGHRAIVNALACNADDVLVSGGDDGSLRFWDYETGYAFQDEQSRAQPGSLDAEAGIYAMAFDQTGSRLVTAEADKTIKIWKEDTDASPESHPVDMERWTAECRAVKRY